jgi:hypothetical protein
VPEVPPAARDALEAGGTGHAAFRGGDFEGQPAVQEGERTLLDNTAIMHCSSMLHGNHDAK